MLFDMQDYRIVHMLGGVRIHDGRNGKFIVSGDTEAEAIKELIEIRTEWARQNDIA